MGRTCRVMVIALSGFMVTMGAQAQKMLLENCNDADPAPGFEVLENQGFIMMNETDNQTWTLYGDDAAWGAWNDFDNDSLKSPEFTASSFTVKYAIRNVVRTSLSEWDNIAVRIGGLASNLDIYLGSSAANDEIAPHNALYMEIQHPDKANGYIWDSKVNRNGQEVPSPWKDYIDAFPDTLEIEIVFRGPQQPLDIYYNFDGQGRSHLLKWNDTEPSSTFNKVLAKGAGDTYTVAIHSNTGSQPTMAFDLDNFKIAGNIESEFAVPDPEFTAVQSWSLY